MAEVIYVLEKVYAMQRKEISDGLKVFLASPNAEVEMKNVLLSAIEIYAEKKLDFVDCLLCGFKKICRCDIFTFDKKPTALLNEL
jgi:predicted nucleic-acid-binding protein